MINIIVSQPINDPIISTNTNTYIKFIRIIRALTYIKALSILTKALLHSICF
jgi:hypothetical protein